MLLLVLNLLSTSRPRQAQNDRPHATPPTLVSAAAAAIDVDHEDALAITLDQPARVTVRPPDSPGDTVADAAGTTSLVLTA